MRRSTWEEVSVCQRDYLLWNNTIYLETWLQTWKHYVELGNMTRLTKFEQGIEFDNANATSLPHPKPYPLTCFLAIFPYSVPGRLFSSLYHYPVPMFPSRYSCFEVQSDVSKLIMRVSKLLIFPSYQKFFRFWPIALLVTLNRKICIVGTSRVYRHKWPNSKLVESWFCLCYNYSSWANISEYLSFANIFIA